MAVRAVLVHRSPGTVWSVLSDGTRYGEWVVGTSSSEPESGTWPQPGSAIRYTVRLGTWRLSGRTIVRDAEPGRRLELEATTRGLGSARIGIEVRPWGDDALVTIDEHPLRGPGGRFHNVGTEFLLQLRHRMMLRRLARVVESA
jgi:uncharacterized protein YndB with AHSA1/START domain